MAPSSEDYSDPKDDLSNIGLLSESELVHTSKSPNRPRCIIVAVVIIVFTHSALFTAGWASGSHRHACLSVAEPPTGVAPALQGLSLEIKPTLLNVTFHDPNHSVYRQHASQKADEAWDALSPTDHEIVLVSQEDTKRSDIDPNRHAYWDEPEKGLLGYPAGIEVVHQLHCLNMLRKNLYFNVEFARERLKETCRPPACVVDSEEIQQQHLDHCVEYLRLRLMCTSDVGLVPLIWVGREGGVTIDNARMHSCRNFDEVLRFSTENAVRLPEMGTIRPRAGDFVLDDWI